MQTNTQLISTPSLQSLSAPQKNSSLNIEKTPEPRNGFGNILKSQISNGPAKDPVKATPQLPQATAAKKQPAKPTDTSDASTRNDLPPANSTNSNIEKPIASAAASGGADDDDDSKTPIDSDADKLILVMTAFAPSTQNQIATQNLSQTGEGRTELTASTSAGKSGKTSPLLRENHAERLTDALDSRNAGGTVASSIGTFGQETPSGPTGESKNYKDQVLETSMAADLPPGKSNQVDPSITAQLQGQSGATTSTTAPTTNAITTPLHSDRWPSEIGQKVVWMVKSEESSATLTLNPPELGPIKVVVHVQNGQAHASFSADQPEVRQALLDAMPRLRDSMQDAGISFGQADVSQGNSQSQQREFSQATGEWRNSLPTSEISIELNTTSGKDNSIETRGLVDTFA